MIYTYKYNSPLGILTIASNGEALTGLWLDGQKYFGDTMMNDKWQEKVLPIFEKTAAWLDIYFSGKNPDFVPPLLFNTSPFRKMVWDILLTIPYGNTMTYGEIARNIAEKTGIGKMSAQAVGGAVGHNQISIIVPCHRVVGTNGSLTGYAGGIERKIKLLELENTDMSRFFIPKKGTAL